MIVGKKIKLENELVPYEGHPLPSGPFLVFAPHPDDETLGMGGTIALATAQSKDVYLILCTNGERGGDGHVRQKEVNEAGQLLGIKKIYYLNLPDRGVFEAPFPDDKIIEIMSLIKPATIFLPSFQEIHPDHRALTHQALSFFQKHDYCFELWLYEINRHGEINRLVDTSSVLEVKKRAINCYHSQLEQIDYKAHALCMDYSRAITLPGDGDYAEGFWMYDWTGDYDDLLGSYGGHIMDYCPAIDGDVVEKIISKKHFFHNGSGVDESNGMLSNFIKFFKKNFGA